MVFLYSQAIAPADEGALLRLFRCNQHQLHGILESACANAVASLVAKGEVGITADRLIADGSIEVGRAPADVPFTIQGE